MPENKYYMINSIVKAFHLLETLVSQKDFDLGELTRRLGYPKPTIHRMLLTLKELGYVKQNDSNPQYSATLKLFQLGHSVLEQNDLFAVGQPRIEELSRATGESVYIGILDGLDVVVSAKAKRGYGLQKDEQIGFRYCSYNSASGRVILAHLPYEERRRLFHRHRLKPSSPQSPTTYAQLEEILQQISRQGYAIEHELYEPGQSCVAAPIFDFNNRVCAALSVNGSTSRIKPDISELIATVRQVASDISTDLGGGD